jgi:ATP-dependent Clp protease ATP-binding subunit ClpA
MLERFTRPARLAVEEAVAAARGEGAAETRPEHLLQALLEDEESLGCRVLADVGAPPWEVREALLRSRGQYVDGLDADDAEALRTIGIDLAEVVRRIGPGPRGGRGHGRPRFGRPAKKVLELALREAVALHHGHIGTEHLLLGLVREGDRVVADALAPFAVQSGPLRAAVAHAVREAG